MFFHYRMLALVVVLFLSCCDLTSAHSLPPRALKNVSHPETLALEILPRQHSALGKRNILSPLSITLRHDDSFRLVIAAFGHRFFLHLAPNNDLIHPSARINYYRIEDGQRVTSHSVPLLRESVRAYWGVVMPEHASADRMREDVARVLHRPHGGPELGWARIMVHHQGDVDQGIAPVFEGAFSANGVIHHITTKDNYLRNRHPLDPEIAQPLDDIDSNLVIWRDSDVMTVHEHAKHAGTLDAGSSSPPLTCAHDSLPYNTDPSLNPTLQRPLSVSSPPWYSLGLMGAFSPLGNDTLEKRDDIAGGGTGANFVNTINDTSGCPKTQKVLYMGVAADCVYTSNYGSQANATKQILTTWNTATTLYKTTFNISLGIIELAIQSESCPNPTDSSAPWNVACNSNVTLNERLSLFSQWRGNRGNDGAGLWHLMSGCPTGSEVGIAWLSTLCQQTASGTDPSVVSGAAVSTAGRTEWQVVAHEISHNFGAIHDCTAGCNSTTSCCPLTASTCSGTSSFLMSPVASSAEMNFSPCTIGNICSLMQSSGNGTNTSCLVDPDPNRTILTLQMCGNGIVEAGEDCDPGPGVNSTCCDSSTCKFTSGAVCDYASSPCCTSNCSLAPSTQICRPSRDPQCDTTEMCTGNSSACPADVFAPNGKSCGSNDLKCAGGICTSLALQCQEAGASMNLQEACPNQSSTACLVSCQDPTVANQCVVLQTQLIDGSPCGYGGVCASGTCQAGDAVNSVKAWYTQNLPISIPVTIIAVLVLAFILWALITGIRRCLARPRPRRIRMQKLPSQDYFGVGWVPPPLPASVRPETIAGSAKASKGVPDRMDRLVPPSAFSASPRREGTSGNMRELILSPGVTRPPGWTRRY